ncbi:hypothetical protein [Kordia sp. SMS9]|uniref:hypothetical protein n=1 Tax=Kordia sp. SMS9 TaxID=2282170 RepID=UPI001F08225D|nr:hypothetical protein [Kordia sp. SMS9]
MIPLLCQEKTVEAVYTAYFELPREALYLHLNKTTYFQGEEIWFTGYAYDQKNQLSSKATTNIKVGIYDAKGNQVKKALYAAENGFTNGNFLIDSTFTAGTYYVKAGTNWMKNFKENNAFVQKIEIVTDESINEKKVAKKATYDFQFLPEGGHILANTNNNIGFKIIGNDGKGVKVSGIVFDEAKKQVASFESNTLGVGKFLFQPKKEIQYTAEITLENNTIITKFLPLAKPKGISLILQSLTENDVILDFSTNEETLKNTPNKTYKILIHQHGKLKTIALKFDELQKAIRIKKEELFKGINTITVFDNDQNPILERLFFNDVYIQKANIRVSKLNKIQDSILLSVQKLNLQKNAQISISVLPEATESYQPKHSIVSNFYLKPHLRGFVENPQYYFQNMDRKKKYELDILLLTQGWSRYDWNAIFDTKPTATHRFENGITISGRVNRPKTNVKQLFFHTTVNHDARFINLDENQKFEMSGLFLKEDEEVRFSYVNEKGEFKKPSMYLRFILSDTKDKLSKRFLDTIRNIKTSAKQASLKEFLYANREALDTVVLTGKKKRKRYEDRFMKRPEVTEVTEEVVKEYDDIANFIRLNGFYTVQEGGEVFDPSKLIGGNPVIFYNNQYLRKENMVVLYNLKLENIERVIVDRYSDILFNGEVRTGIIKIFTRDTPLFSRKLRNFVYLSTKTPKSFTEGKKYYTPNYASFLSPTFQQYGAISWLPNLELNPETATTFKIYDTFTENVTLFIEGITEDGDLISERKTIQVR